MVGLIGSSIVVSRLGSVRAMVPGSVQVRDAVQDIKKIVTQLPKELQ